jgi:hypothetical protein
MGQYTVFSISKIAANREIVGNVTEIARQASARPVLQQAERPALRVTANPGKFKNGSRKLPVGEDRRNLHDRVSDALGGHVIAHWPRITGLCGR